jgi:hypothetical protein
MWGIVPRIAISVAASQKPDFDTLKIENKLYVE